MIDNQPDNLPARRGNATAYRRPENKCTLKRFSGPYYFHQRYGYACREYESPVGHSIAMGILSDASDAWNDFVAEISGQDYRRLLDRSVRQMSALLSRLEAMWSDAAAGASFETYSQVRAGFVSARMQLDQIMDEVYDGNGPMPVVRPPTAPPSRPRHALPRSDTGGRTRREHPGIDVTVPTSVHDEAPRLPAYESTEAAVDQPQSHPLLEGAAYKLGLLVGGVIGAAVIFSALAGR